MSMEIRERYHYYKTDYADSLRAEPEKGKETEQAQKDGSASGKISALQDEYIRSEKSGTKPGGLYRVGRDEDGKKRIFYDDPKKSGDGDKGRQAEVKSVSSGKPEETCTVNTDKTEREIRKLKEKQQQLRQQIRAASGDEEKIRELEKELARVESELNQKDNDTFKKQNAAVSCS